MRRLVLLALGAAALLSACGGGSRGPSGTNVSVVGVGPSGAAPVGSAITVEMTVRNAGPDDAATVRITSGTSNASVTAVRCQARGGATCPAVLGPSMTLDALPAGGELVFAIDARVLATATLPVTSSLTASTQADLTPADNVATVTVPIVTFDLAATATGPAEAVAGGATTSVAVTVANAGPDDARDVELTNAPGSQLALGGTIVCTASAGAVCPPSTGASMRAPLIPAGGQLVFDIPLTVAAGANGRLSDSFTVTAAGDAASRNNTAVAAITARSNDLGVSLSGPDRVAAGSSAVYQAVVANAGTSAAGDIAIRWTTTAPFTPGTLEVSCTASAGATCPSTLGASMTVPSLGAGRGLVLRFSVPVPADGRGTLQAAISIDAVGDPNAANNAATVEAVAEDGRNGSYQAFATDGRRYELAIDFDAGRYTMAGNGASVERRFTAQPGGEYLVSGIARLRTATDLVVGGHDFGRGVLPFVAARRFVSDASALVGAFNLVTRNVAPDGSSAATRAATASFSGNVLTVCQDDFQVVLTQACPTNARRSYEVALDGDLITGTDAVAGQPAFAFRIARSGAARILLAAGPSTSGTVGDDTLQLRIGLLEGSGLVDARLGGPAVGADRAGDWITMVLTPTTYAAEGTVGALDDVAGLGRPGTTSPYSMLRGAPTPTLGGAPVWVMQSAPLAIAFGNLTAPTGTTTASGLLQITLP